jgi:SNF2 family DNA or RNA helicase
VEALVDLYEELQGEPLLVSIGYRHDTAAIRRALGAKIPCLDGETPRSQFASTVEDWNRGRIPILLGHPASMGHALNMQKCNCRHVAFFDIPDDYDLYDQLFRRVWRQGNEAPFCMKHHFVASNTVDAAKMINLSRKGRGQRDFLDAMREYAEARYGSFAQRVT